MNVFIVALGPELLFAAGGSGQDCRLYSLLAPARPERPDSRAPLRCGQRPNHLRRATPQRPIQRHERAATSKALAGIDEQRVKTNSRTLQPRLPTRSIRRGTRERISIDRRCLAAPQKLEGADARAAPTSDRLIFKSTSDTCVPFNPQIKVTMSANQPELINLAGDGEEIIFVREEIDLASSSSEDVDEGDVEMVDVSSEADRDIEDNGAAGAGNQPRVHAVAAIALAIPVSRQRRRGGRAGRAPGTMSQVPGHSPTWYDQAVSSLSEEAMETDGELEDDPANADEEAASLEGERAADGEAVAEEEAAGANNEAEEPQGARYARAFPLAPQEGEEPAGTYDDLTTEESRDAYERTLMGHPVLTGLLMRCEHVVVRYFQYDDVSWVSSCCGWTTRGHGAREVTLHLVGLSEALDDHLTTCPLCDRAVGRSRRPAEQCELYALVVLLNEDDTEEGMVFNSDKKNVCEKWMLLRRCACEDIILYRAVAH
ncbi:unnamed protein product [Trichogramma brassicae]|uniref:Uncharacterized protein n=1 Tax=Trichogramma brassicae TaxID=86971 RepID=A0A6H5I345_9HYME|nr:unnamed protein product [Trichogramma brassicae]